MKFDRVNSLGSHGLNPHLYFIFILNYKESTVSGFELTTRESWNTSQINKFTSDYLFEKEYSRVKFFYTINK